eukprot:1351740-Amphidinium_carterae.1
MLGALAELQALWESIKPDLSKAEAQKTWQAFLLAANLPSKADVSKSKSNVAPHSQPAASQGSG